MTRTRIMIERCAAGARIHELAARRRVSYEELALAHVASGRPDVQHVYLERARAIVPTDLMVDTRFGATFADTLDLNRTRYDLYEAGGRS